MNKVLLLVGLVTIFLTPLKEASANVMMKRVPSDIAGVDLILSCEPGPIAADYSAETASGVPLTDPYAVERDADKGLVHLMNQGGKRAKQYIVPHRLIRAIVRIKYGMDVLDRVDLVFTPRHLLLIHTSTANAGIFTDSDVYDLRYSRTAGADQKPLQGDQQLLQELALGLSFYQTCHE